MRALFVLLSIAASCTPLTSGFECQHDEQCTSSPGDNATCEPCKRRCSLPDKIGGCLSGRRYSDEAGEPSGTCTPDPSTGMVECTIAKLAAGNHATCAVETDGSVWCWGNRKSAPVQITIPTGGDIAEIALGGDGLCVRYERSGDNVACAPISSSPNPTSPFDPLTSVPGLQAISIAVGANHKCAVTTGNGEVECWGSNAHGQLGIGTPDQGAHALPALAAKGVTQARQVAAGGETTCAVITSGEVWCWGANESNSKGTDVLGRGACGTCNVGEPQSIQGHILDGAFPDDMESVTVGARSGCARSGGGEVWCWGSNQNGELGIDDMDVTSSNDARRVPGPGFSQLVCSDDHCCARGAVDQVSCWGNNMQKQTSSTSSSAAVFAPQPVGNEFTPALRFVDIVAGVEHTCGRSTDLGRVWCWGGNTEGEFGNGEIGAIPSSPMQVQNVCVLSGPLVCQ
jgi:alpha-tubulin suppressor-like RCC1 family protein